MSWWEKLVYTFIVANLTLCHAYAIKRNTLSDARESTVSANPKVFEINEEREDTHSTSSFRYILQDSLHQFTIEQVEHADFKLYADFIDSIGPWDNYSTYWIKFVVKNTLEDVSDWVVVLSSRNSYVDFYIKNRDGTFTVKKSGSILPVKEKEFKKHNGIMFSLNLAPGDTKELYFKIRRINNFPPRFDINFESRAFWESQTGDENKFIVIGFLQGAIWLMAIFFFTFFVSSREKSYLYYAVFLIFAALYFLFDEFPYVYQLLLGDQVHLILHIWVFVNLLYVFFAIFVRNFVNAPKLIPKWDFLFKILIFTRLACALIAVCIIIFWYDFALADLIYSTYLMPFEIACWFILTVVMFHKGDKVVRYFLVGVVMFVLSAMLLTNIIVHTNLDDDWLLYVQTAGFTIQFLFFSSAIGYRSHLLNVEKKKANLKYIKQLRENERLQSRVNLELEDKVRERTVKIIVQNHALKQQSKRLKELDHLKSQFFANISHEFRTPLTLMLAPLQKLYDQVEDSSLKSQYAMMIRHGENLLDLINQLLDLSQQKEGKLAFKAQPIDVIAFVKSIAVSFVSFAESKKIDYQYEFPQKEIIACCDPDKLKRIIENLLSNAFKFTPQHGQVKLKLSGDRDHNYHGGTFTITVEDTGIGIPADKAEYIFDRFYQIDSPQSRGYGGTGIGLALVKEYVHLHKGTIQVKSKEGNGAKFIVRLPLDRRHVSAEEIGEQKAPLTIPASNRKIPVQTEMESKFTGSSKNDKELTEILLLEDNHDMRNFIKTSLASDYYIIEASNAHEGLVLAKSHIPDLIISDIMMPGMSGLEFCKQIKENTFTSHIPIIMLTARADLESRITGWSVGADAYVTKPFDLNELDVRIKNLLFNRKKLQEKYNQNLFYRQYEDKSKAPLADPFLQKLENVLENHYKNPHLQIEDLTKEMAMSRSQLYRKIKSLTGNSPNAFIRKFRLHRAARLLREEYGSVATISDAVGFNNDSYFSKCFQQEFGHLPSEHLANIQK